MLRQPRNGCFALLHRTIAPSLGKLFSPGELAKNTYLATCWLGARVIGQAIWMVLLARTLGPESYGVFAGVAGLATAVGTLTGFGFGVLMLQDASRDPSGFSAAWRRAVAAYLTSGLVFLLGYLACASLFFKEAHPYSLYVWVGIAEVLCFPVAALASYAFQVYDRMGWGSALHALVPAGNLIAITAFLASPSHTLTAYLPLHAATAVLVALVSLLSVRGLLSPGAGAYSIRSRDVYEGGGFSIMRLVDTGLVSLDKALVLQLAGSGAAGIYSSAYRLITVLALPITSLSMSVLPRLFRSGIGKPGAQFALARKLAAVLTGYGLLAGVAVWIISNMLPLLLGDAFLPAARIARLLALSPLLLGLYTLAGNLLVTSNMRGLRVAAQGAGIIIMLATGVFLLPRFGLDGAVLMLLSTQAATAALMWACFFFGQARQPRQTSE